MPKNNVTYLDLIKSKKTAPFDIFYIMRKGRFYYADIKLLSIPTS